MLPITKQYRRVSIERSFLAETSSGPKSARGARGPRIHFLPHWLFVQVLSPRYDTAVEPPIKNLIENRKARHEYTILDTFEAGISLLGTEVKSLRAGTGNLKEAFILLKNDGAWLMQCHIPAYTQGNRQNHEPIRPRQLLLHHHELSKLRKGTNQKGMTVVPLRMYLKGHRLKLEIALAKGKKDHDKRQTLKERDAVREMRRQ